MVDAGSRWGKMELVESSDPQEAEEMGRLRWSAAEVAGQLAE